jgi:hypothetical protein
VRYRLLDTTKIEAGDISRRRAEIWSHSINPYSKTYLAWAFLAPAEDLRSREEIGEAAGGFATKDVGNLLIIEVS